MIYPFFEKDTRTLGVCTSLTALETRTGIKYDTLTYHFTRNNRKTYENKSYLISKVNPISSKRKSKCD